MKSMSVKEIKLLEKVVNYYKHCFLEAMQAQEYLQNIGVTRKETFSTFNLGFSDGSLLEILPDDEATISSLKKLNILDQKGNETFQNHITIPSHDGSGTLVNLCGFNIVEEQPQELLFMGESSIGLINRHSVKRASTLILSSSIQDSLVLHSQGFENTIPIYKYENLSKEHLRLISGSIKEIYFCITSQDDSTKVESITAQLAAMDIAIDKVEIPFNDFSTFFKNNTPEEFELLLERSNASIKQSDAFSMRKQTIYVQEANGFIVGYGKRQYQVKGIQRLATQLKAAIKISKDVSSNQAFELTTIDLFSSRSRHWFAKLCASLFNEPEALMQDDIAKVLELVEKWQPSKSKSNTGLSKSDEKTALTFLQSENLFEKLLQDFEVLGVAGEETNKLVGYLAATSRKMDKPLSVHIQSQSVVGQTLFKDALLSIIPDEDIIRDPRKVAKAPDSLKHKVIITDEKMNVDGACVISSTTGSKFNHDQASNSLILELDDSASMTESIHQLQREAATLEGLIKSQKKDLIINKHHAIQRMLKPVVVVNPYAKQLSYPSISLQARRDHDKYLSLIRAVAYMNQYKREKKLVTINKDSLEYIEVSLDDISLANRLASVVLGHSMDELSTPSKTLLSLIKDMVEKASAENDEPIEKVSFTRRMIREFTGWSHWQVKTHIKQLEELEYLVAESGSKGKKYSYVLSSFSCEHKQLNLTHVDEIQEKLKAA